MEKKKIELPSNQNMMDDLTSESVYPISNYNGVGRFRSIRRAIRRGKADPSGHIYPDRPFNNRKTTRGRKENENRKRIYDQFKLTGLHREDEL